MSAFTPKTRAQQRLEYLSALHRPLSDAESDELRRSLHAVYCHNRKQLLAMHREEEMELLDRVLAESSMPDVGERA